MADETETRALLGGGCLGADSIAVYTRGGGLDRGGGGLWLFFSCRKMEVKANTSISNA